MAELLTTSRAAARAGVDEETIRHYIRNGTLPAQTTPGGHYRINPADLATFLADRGQAVPSGPVTIAIAHHAGGVGKTTLTLNLGYALAAAGRRTLIVDLDPQADLSERLGLTPAAPTLAGVLVGRVQGPPARRTCLWEGVEAHFDLVPGELSEMADVEVQLMALQMREQRLSRALAPLRRHYDILLLDCPPNLSLLTTNALWAADGVIIPVQSQDKALRQLPKIVGSITAVQEFRDGPPGVLGFVLTMADKREAMSAEVEQELRAGYGGDVFTTVIPRRTRQAEDARWHAPVALYAPRDGATAYAALAQEVIARARA